MKKTPYGLKGRRLNLTRTVTIIRQRWNLKLEKSGNTVTCAQHVKLKCKMQIANFSKLNFSLKCKW
jgi:hypothetical protein